MTRHLILFILIFFVFSAISQSKWENKFTVDYTCGISITERNIPKPLLQYVGTITDNHFNFNYKIGRKATFELRAGYNSLNFSGRRGYPEVSIHKFSYGAGFNIFLKNSYAPLGNSIGIFYQSNNYIPRNYNEFYDFLSNGELSAYETETIINYKSDIIGFQLNLIAMLSNDYPLYFKYGFNIALPLSFKIYDASYSKEPFDEYQIQHSSKNWLNDDNLSFTLRRMDIYRIYFGIGFMI